MEIFYPAAVIFCVIYIFIINHKLSEIGEEMDELEERLTQIEKDAVKITFSEPPLFHPKPKTQSDYAREHSKEFEAEVKNVIITTLKEKQKKRKPKTTKDWEDEFDLGGHE